MDDILDTDQIKGWRSIVTLIVFILTNLTVLFPFNVWIYIPSRLSDIVLHSLVTLRVISPKHRPLKYDNDDGSTRKVKPFMPLKLRMNFVTAPLLADLFLLAISAIGRQEVHDGTVGADNISPIDIMVFFLTLAYIAISIDASGLIRWLALKTLEKGGKNGHSLFLYLYAFFFSLGSFIGNDPIILSGTAFLAYMTRVSENIHNPRAWIHTQFTVANVVSAVLVSSNPTNLVIAGAFNIKFIHYTANMIIPVAVTGAVLLPFLLYVVFSGKDEVENKDFIPSSIAPKVLPAAIMDLKPGNPNITHGRNGGEEEKDMKANNEKGKLRMAEEIMNPYLDWTSAAFGAALMSITLITILVLNAASQSTGAHPVYWVTVPAAFLMFCWDVFYGLSQLDKWQQGFQKYQEDRDRIEDEELERMAHERGQSSQVSETESRTSAPNQGESNTQYRNYPTSEEDEIIAVTDCPILTNPQRLSASTYGASNINEDAVLFNNCPPVLPPLMATTTHGERKYPDVSTSMATADSVVGEHEESRTGTALPVLEKSRIRTSVRLDEKEGRSSADISDGFDSRRTSGPNTLESLLQEAVEWLQKKFPTVTVVVAHLPFPLVPFALSMFVLVQGLVTNGWVPVFAYGWDHWVNKTGTVGAIGGMGFLSVVLCNFAGTNIGSAILLSRVVQAWQEIHHKNGIPISNRTFWATVYSMALGVNYGAFSAVFSASLAGLLWRDILGRKYIVVKPLEFAKVNLPIITVAMAISCAVLVAEVYVVRDDSPYDA